MLSLSHSAGERASDSESESESFRGCPCLEDLDPSGGPNVRRSTSISHLDGSLGPSSRGSSLHLDFTVHALCVARGRCYVPVDHMAAVTVDPAGFAERALHGLADINSRQACPNQTAGRSMRCRRPYVCLSAMFRGWTSGVRCGLRMVWGPGALGL